MSLNFHSSPPTTPNHCWVGTSGLFWTESSRSPASLSSDSCLPASAASSSFSEVPLELLPLYSLSPSSTEWTKEPAGDDSLLSDRRTPLPELYSLFESAPRAVIKQKGRGRTDGERAYINKHHTRKDSLPQITQGRDSTEICMVVVFELQRVLFIFYHTWGENIRVFILKKVSWNEKLSEFHMGTTCERLLK